MGRTSRGALDEEEDERIPLHSTSSRSALETEPQRTSSASSLSFLQRLLSHQSSIDTQRFSRLPSYDADELGGGDAQESPSKRAHRWCPEEEAGLLGSIAFSWVGGLLNLGVSKALEMEDLWDTAVVDEVESVSERFQRNLDATADSMESPQGVVGQALWRTHRTLFLRAGVIKFFHDCTLFLGPFLLEVLLKHIQAGGSRVVGALLALALTGSSVIQTLAINRYFHIVFRICLHVKSALIEMLYDKSLRIDSSTKSGMGVGAIVNLQSNDASKLYKLPQYLHMLWSAPFQILMVMAMLIRVLSFWPAFVGLMVTVGLIPLSSFVARALARVRKKIVGLTDARVKLSSEVILGIKAIKLYAWEEAYKERIMDLRAKELRAIRLAALVGLWNSMLWLGGPILISMAAFFTYTWLGYELDASTAFPALSLFNLLRFPVMMFPTQLENIINAKIAMDRIQNYLEKDEMKMQSPKVGILKGDVSVKGSFGWGGEEVVSLDCKVASGQLVMVVGEVGSGKTSLLLAVLGEMNARGGNSSIHVGGSISYTQQDPWIQNMSLRDNILLGREYEEQKYLEVIRACALGPDLAALPAGDQTEIGEKGVNLSGGQRHRVALARACYAESDVYLLDDPLSAVDAHVGRHLMNECMLSLLAGTTRILVTHQLQYLPASDAVIVVKGGRIVEYDTYESLVSKGVDFHQFEAHDDIVGDVVDESKIIETDGGFQEAGPAEGGTGAEANDKIRPERNVSEARDDPRDILQEHRYQNETNHPDSSQKQLSSSRDEKKMKITKAEERAVGQVQKRVYLKYFSVWGTRLLPGLILPMFVLSLAIMEKGLQSGQSWWLSVWSTAVDAAPSSSEVQDAWYYMRVYFAIGMVSLLVQIARQVSLVLGSLVASGSLQRSLLDRVLRLPMSFFDSQPTGRLLNRFTKDIEAVDTSLQSSLSSFLSCSVSVMWSLIVVVVVSPATAVAFFPITFAYAKIQKLYVSTSRELKRLDSLAMSPIFSSFSETLLGLATVRAFRAQQKFRAKNRHFLNQSNRCYWPIQCVNRWLSIRLELTGAFIVLCSAIVVAGILPTSAGLAGLALTSALNLTGLMSWMVRQTTELEVNMNSVERLIEYDDEPTEAPSIIPSNRPLPNWPSRGEVLVESLMVRYRPELDPVLHDVSFKVGSGQKVGIAGRTGCGKSTLMMALYRIVEPCSGRVVIDNVDVGCIGLQDLRSRLSLVPQDAIIFSGSVRSNVDPFGSATSDDVVWEVLRQAGLQDTVQAMGGLDIDIAEQGGNLSSGQRQLLCMARALLRSSRILILDEATSSIDTATDKIIQKTINTAFKSSTVLTIAHRLHTIINSDMVLVLDSGRVAEYDAPQRLLQQTNGAFARLVSEASVHSNQ
jgi:ATP-binding cassette subfamily C (CFTR/MRP) protein 1